MENIEALKKYFDIKKLEITDKEYPEKLKEIYDPPKKLYVKGDISILNKKSIAIVGTRMCSNYGRKIAKQLSYEIAQRGIITISGLARGIDTFAHIGTINAKEKTIAVLGCGIDIIYPPENKYLADEILKNGGAIITEYDIGEKPLGTNFPKRNRIISGLSDGVIVVEAQKRSGTFITVDFALEQGKEVYVVPGNIDSKTSTGTNELIKQGAKLITEPEDILEDFK